MKNKKATIMIYILVLITISVTLALMLLNNSSLFKNNFSFHSFERKFYENMKKDSSLLLKINHSFNSNGSGFVDNLRCGEVFMSGATNSGTFQSSLKVEDNLAFCSGSFDSQNIKIYFNSGFTDFQKFNYSSQTGELVNGSGKLENTLISITNYSSGDLIDDNLNDDNYSPILSGSQYYPDNYEDDDSDGRKEINGYVKKEDFYKKIFWNNKKVAEFINGNINNTGSTKKLGEVENGKIYLEVDSSAEIKIVEFNKSRFETTGELIVLSSKTGILETSGSGYLQDNLSFGNKNTAKIFDFKNEDFAIFLKTDGNLLYKLKAEIDSGEGIYIVPIDDSQDDSIKILANDIIFEKGKYIYKQKIFE